MDLKLNITGQIVAASYTSVEKQAIYQALCGAIKTDGKVDEREIKVLNQIKSVMLITEADIIASRTRASNESLRVLRSMTDIKKCYFMKFAALICLADNQVHPSEEGWMNWIAQEIGAPDID